MSGLRNADPPVELNVECKVDRNGAKLASLESDGLAVKLGLRRGDVIKSINSVVITTLDDISRALHATIDELVIMVDRNGKSLQLKSAWPANY